MSIWVWTDVIKNSKILFFLFYSCFSEQINRRQFSKSESLLVSLLKQEAITEKKQDIQSNKISSIIKTNQKINDDDDIIIVSNNTQLKLDKKDPDFRIKKQKISKKTTTTTNKNQVFIYYKIILFLMKALS